MSAKFNKDQFFKLAHEIKEELNIDINTTEELDVFRKENPEKYEQLVNKVEKALTDSVVGGSFEELDEEAMIELQGAGDVKPETTPACVFIGVSIGVAISKAACR